LSSVSARLEAAAERDAATSTDNVVREPIDKYTCTTMPTVHDPHPTAALDHIDIALVTEWEKCPGGKLLAIPFGADVQDITLHDNIRDKIFTAVAEITQSRDIGTSTPRRSKTAERQGHAPKSFLIFNLTDTHYDLLLHRKVWSSAALTFRVIQLNPPCPDFLFALQGFASHLTNDILHIVRSAWQHPEVLALADNFAEAYHADFRAQVKSAILEFLNSVKVTLLDVKSTGEVLQPRFNVYASGDLIHNDSVWLFLRKFLASRKYGSPTHGDGITDTLPFRCTICHGADHPKGLCPFPALPGWNGPGSPNATPPNRGRRGRGGMGRGSRGSNNRGRRM
jgi:hypothetical protein